MVYGYPDDEDKHKVCNILKALNHSSPPWFCCADFNEILGNREENVEHKNQNLIREFEVVVNICDLCNMGFEGHDFT